MGNIWCPKVVSEFGKVGIAHKRMTELTCGGAYGFESVFKALEKVEEMRKAEVAVPSIVICKIGTLKRLVQRSRSFDLK